MAGYFLLRRTPPRPRRVCRDNAPEESTPIALDSFYPKMLLSYDAVSIPLLSRILHV